LIKIERRSLIRIYFHSRKPYIRLLNLNLMLSLIQEDISWSDQQDFRKDIILLI
jgi:hypothetical protein